MNLHCTMSRLLGWRKGAVLNIHFYEAALNKLRQSGPGERTDWEDEQLFVQENKVSLQQGELTSSYSHKPIPSFASILREMLPPFPSSL